MNGFSFEELMELEQDLKSAALIISRLAGDDGKRSTLDEVIASFGFDRTTLEAELESEISSEILAIGARTESIWENYLSQPKS